MIYKQYRTICQVSNKKIVIILVWFYADENNSDEQQNFVFYQLLR